MNRAAGEARNATASATSSGAPIRPSATPCRYSWNASGGVPAWRSTGIQPGSTVFTVIPYGPSSRAQDRVSPCMAALAAT